MMKNNEFFEEMKQTGHAWEERRVERRERKTKIIDTFGWDSEELAAWYAEDKADGFPFTAGQNKAYIAWEESLHRSEDELEMSEFLFDNEVSDFIETLRKAGIHSFIYTNCSTAVMDNIHAFDAEGFKMMGLCSATRLENRWGEEKAYEVQGIRFEDEQTPPTPDRDKNVPVDMNDPEGAKDAVELELPGTFSAKAKAAWRYFDDTAFLFEYKGRLVVTDESLYLTEYGNGTPEAPLGFPRWVCDSMDELEKVLEAVYGELREDGVI